MAFKKNRAFFVTLIVLPSSILLSLVISYIALFGLQLPFEIKMRVQAPTGELMTQRELDSLMVKMVRDSLSIWRTEVRTLIDSTKKLRLEFSSLQDTITSLSQKKMDYENQLKDLEIRLSEYEKQQKKINKEKVNRLAKIFKAISQEKLDSLYVASLDDRTLLSIISQAKEQQAALILQQMEPRRAASLTARFLNQNNR